MKLTHIDNACCIYESQGFKLLCDPWLTDGAFCGSWYHYPPLITNFDFIKDVDALYISHLHPDHYDEMVLKQFSSYNPDIPIIVLDKHPNFLKRKLDNLFKNVYHIKDRETITVGPMEVTVYAPFTTHPFDESVIGNLIDSAIVVESNGKIILNANDNTPDEDAARMLLERHGPFTVVQLKDSLAGAYPSCFLNLSSEEKLSEANILINRQLTAMCKVASILKAEWFQPFAGDYQLGGKLADKNKFLGVAGKRFSAEFIASHGLKPLILSEQSSIDLITQEVISAYRKNIPDYGEWLDKISKIKFAYELDPKIEIDRLIPKLFKARDKLRKFQQQYNYYPDLTVSVNGFHFSLTKEEKATRASIKFTLDNRALARVLDKRYHWNSLEVGCHIEVGRVPNIYDPDLVNAMCFFHV